MLNINPDYESLDYLLKSLPHRSSRRTYLIADLSALSDDDLLDIAISRLDDARTTALIHKLCIWSTASELPDPLPLGLWIVILSDTTDSPEDTWMDVPMIRGIARDLLDHRPLDLSGIVSDLREENVVGGRKLAKMLRSGSMDWGILGDCGRDSGDWAVFTYAPRQRWLDRHAVG